MIVSVHLATVPELEPAAPARRINNARLHILIHAVLSASRCAVLELLVVIMMGLFIVLTARCLLLITLGSIPTFGQTQQDDQPPNVVTELPHEKFYYIGGSFDLECVVTGHPPPQITWMKDGLPISERSEHATILERGTLHVEDASMFDTGQYHCRASNQYGTAVGMLCLVQMASLAMFPPLPDQIHVVKPRESLKLHCEPPSSSPPPIIHWTKVLPSGESHSLVLDNTKSMDSSGNLYFSSVSPEDANVAYACVAYNAFVDLVVTGRRHSVRLTQDPLPNYIPSHHLWSSESEPTALLGSTLTIECVFGGYPTPNVLWIGPSGLAVSGEVSDNRKFFIPRVRTSDAGLYRCQTGESGALNYEFQVTVAVKPYWEKHPENLVRVGHGEDLVVECNARGVPDVVIRWFFNGMSIASEPRLSISREGRQLTLENATDADSKVIQCYASNSHGYVFANIPALVMSSPPFVVREPLATLATVGGTGVLDCRSLVTGFPTPTLHWTRNDQPVTAEDRFRFDVDTGNLLISDVRPTDAGAYLCEALNPYGSDSTTLTLDVESLPTSETPLITSPAPTEPEIVVSGGAMTYSDRSKLHFVGADLFLLKLWVTKISYSKQVSAVAKTKSSWPIVNRIRPKKASKPFRSRRRTECSI